MTVPLGWLLVSLVPVQFVHLWLTLGSQEEDSALQVWPSQGILPLGKGWDYFALSAVNAPPNAAQDATGLLCSKGTLLAHVQLVHQDPQVLFCKAGKSIFVEMSSRSLAFIY